MAEHQRYALQYHLTATLLRDVTGSDPVPTERRLAGLSSTQRKGARDERGTRAVIYHGSPIMREARAEAALAALRHGATTHNPGPSARAVTLGGAAHFRTATPRAARRIQHRASTEGLPLGRHLPAPVRPRGQNKGLAIDTEPYTPWDL
jgi:hypothetical protein